VIISFLKQVFPGDYINCERHLHRQATINSYVHYKSYNYT